MPLQIPMGEYVKNGFFRPPGLEIPGLVFGESAVVQDAEFRSRSRELERIGFSPVVEARPVEKAPQPGTVQIILPSAADDIVTTVNGVIPTIQRSHMAVFLILEINATGAASACFLRTQGLSLGILDPEIVYAVLP